MAKNILTFTPSLEVAFAQARNLKFKTTVLLASGGESLAQGSYCPRRTDATPVQPGKDSQR